MADQTISHYKILRHVSDGVGGRVYKAEDTILRRKVALKFLPQELNGDPEASRRFLREARSTSNIDHPNICNIHEIGETEEGDLFIAMTWYNGCTLKKHLSREKPSVVQALEFTRQIARGLARAHERDVIHRDIKPSNIIITEHNELKIVDFGLARLLTASRMTNMGTILGTASYMSPEQARGEDASPLSDLWSLGVVLYEMLTGRLPFTGDHEVAVLYSVLNSDPEPLSMEICPEGCRCSAIVNKCLEKDSDKRYQNAEDLLHDLEQALSVAKMKLEKHKFLKGAGERLMKMGRPMKAGLVMLALMLMTQAFPQGRSTLQQLNPLSQQGPCPGVAILPFTFTGADDDQKALANGLSWFTAEMVSRFEDRTDRFWVVPTGITQREGINSGQDAKRLLGIGCTISGTGHIQGDRISLRLTINNTWNDKQTTHIVEDNLANLKTWQFDVPRLLATNLDPEIEIPVSPDFSDNMTNIPLAFREYLTGIGYSHGVDNENDYEQAIFHLNKSVYQDSSFACSITGLASAICKNSSCRDTTQLALAESYLQKATSLHPNHARAWVQLGDILRMQGKSDEARLAYENALVRDEINEGALRGMWDLEMNAGNTAEASKYLMLASEARPNYFNIIDNVGVHQYYQGNFAAAESSFRRLVELAPQQHRGFNLLGATLFEMDKYPASEMMFENSLAIEPTYTAYSNLATLYFYSGRMLDSIEMSRKAIAIDDSRYHAWRTLGESYYWSPGLRDSSRSAYQHCVNLVTEELADSPLGANSANQILVSDLATCQVRLGEFDEARKLLGTLENENNLGIPVMFNLASAFEEMNQRDKALHWLELAVEADLSLAQVERYPGLRNLRTHPRFLSLRQKYEKK